MLIYVVLEIPVRELPGHTHFAVEAVARGHQVIVTSFNDFWLFHRLGLLKPGVLLAKNTKFPSFEMEYYKSFIAAGHMIYCQEQEPPFIWDSFDKFLYRRRFVKGDQLPFVKVFCYGERDTEGYSKFFDKQKNVFVNTGSPRTDLWLPKYKNLYLSDETKRIGKYVLVVSNYASVMGKSHLSERMKHLNRLELLGSHDKELDIFKSVEEEFKILIDLVSAIKYVSARIDGVKFVVRPHPNDKVEYWNNIFHDSDDVLVDNAKGSITPLIAGACAIIQNGCTTALEAAVLEVPVISYGPDRMKGGKTIPNDIGIRVRNANDLMDVVNKIDGNDAAVLLKSKGKEVLKPLLNTNGTAAQSMLDLIEEQSSQMQENMYGSGSLFVMNIAKRVKSVVDKIRKLANRGMVRNKPYRLDPDAIQSDVDYFSGQSDVNINKIRFIGGSGFFLSRK